MPFAVELYLDEETDEAVRAVWRRLAAAKVGGTPPDSRSRPHVTLAAFQEADSHVFEPALAAFAQATPSLAFTLVSLGVFPTSESVIFFAPVVTRSLLDLHERFHQVLTEVGATSFPYYVPGKWVPHCTIAIGIPPEHVSTTVELCREGFLPIQGRFTHIGLITYTYRPVMPMCAYPLQDADTPT
ncbi:MAG TPA: 2'-5' RNA ligase family protein [Chloroflexota bacterium]|nr:2'-5' RNA ligase family protein [Chloroflexota bacterium]